MVGETAIVSDLRLMALAILGGREGVDALVEATMKRALIEVQVSGSPVVLRPWMRALMETVRDQKVSEPVHSSQTRSEPVIVQTEGSENEVLWTAFRSLPRDLRMILIAFTLGRGDSTTAGSIMGIGPDEADRLYARALDLMGRITEAT
ncbi:hypothetical protein [Nioella sp.]|uniref:hypothetical protein n=1 Tax=Nioella sp. TaxID=1912091 RepID=UPI003510FE29